MVWCNYDDSATELYLLPCGKKCAAPVPVLVAIIINLLTNIFRNIGFRWGTGDFAAQADEGGPLACNHRQEAKDMVSFSLECRWCHSANIAILVQFHIYGGSRA